MSNDNTSKNENGAVFLSNAETFTEGFFNGIPVIRRDADGHINVSKMCRQFNRHQFRSINDLGAWRDYVTQFCIENNIDPNKNNLLYELKKAYSNEAKGTYVDERLINFVAIWASPAYACLVGRIMTEYSSKKG
jgi:hypothetical protein